MIEEHNPDFSKPPPVSFPDVFPAMSSRKPGLSQVEEKLHGDQRRVRSASPTVP